MLSYWFEDQHQQIETGEAPLEITVPVVAAGAITGQVLNADGTPATEGISLNVQGIYKKDRSTHSGGFGNDKSDAKGKFFMTPLPLGGKYVVSALRGHTIQCSSMIELDATKPTVNITLQMPHTTTVEGQVLDPDGKPLANFTLQPSFSPAVNTLTSQMKLGERGWGGLHTDNQGRFCFNDFGVDVGKYSLDFMPKRNFHQMCVPLPLDGKPVTIQMQRGLVIEGQVIDDATGKPVPGVELIAMPESFKEGDFTCEAEGVTDAQGRFRFSTLHDHAYHISARGAIKIIDGEKKYQPGGAPIVLHTNSTFDKGFGNPIRVDR
jgi:hypothetical protein